jgi:hypothetical protein
MVKRQTRKAQKLSKLPPLMGTQSGLDKWHDAMFEKLGWMVLAKEKGLDYKVDAYKKSLERLILMTKHVSSEYESHNRKHDLNVTLLNVMCLKSFVDKHL